MKKQLGFYVDVSKCTGCKTCQVACKAKKQSPPGVSFRRVYEYSGGAWQKHSDNTWSQDVFGYFVSISCNHCENPICVKSCPTTAMHKNENGLVTVDETKCVGCRYCEWSCPYGAPQYDPELKHMTKCDGCIDRLAKGEQPLCVISCPLRALDFGPIDELRAKYGDDAGIAPLPSPKLTSPHLTITGGKNARPCQNKDGSVLNKTEV